MKKFFNFGRFVSLFALACIISCQKPTSDGVPVPSENNHAEYAKNLVDESVVGLYVVREGILHFRDSKAFDEVSEKMKSMKGEERQRFWKEVAFSSYADEFTNLSEKLADSKSKPEYDEILSQNQDIIEMQMDGAVRPKAGDKLMNHFINRQELVYIGKMLYQFGKTQQKIAFDGSLSTIKQTQKSKSLDILSTKPVTLKNARLCTYFFKQKEEGGDRRAGVWTDVYSSWIAASNSGGITFYNVRWNIRVKGYPEKKSWGSWNNYRTDNNLIAGFYFNVTSLNFGGSSGAKAIVCNLSNYWWDITYDDYIQFTQVTNPEAFVSGQTYSLDDVSPGPYIGNFYSTGGVSSFQYGCP